MAYRYLNYSKKVSSKKNNKIIATISEGNKKLKNTSQVRWLVWSLPSVVTCPYRTRFCTNSCYANKAERQYSDVLPSRQRNFEFSKLEIFVDYMISFIKNELSRKAMLGKKIVFRIHESGDFYNQAYANKWLEICKHFENNDNIVFLAYTKSVIFFENADLPKNLVIRASVWEDTDKDALAIMSRYPIYTAIESFESDTNHEYAHCKCNDCSNCGMCWNKNIKQIACEIH